MPSAWDGFQARLDGEQRTSARKEKRRNFPHKNPGLDFFCFLCDLSVVLLLNIMQEFWRAYAEKTELVSPSEISKNSCLKIYIHIIYVPSSPWDLPCHFRWEIWPFAYELNVKRHHRAAKQPDETLQQKWKPGYCAQTLDWGLYPVRRQDLLLWMSMNSSRTEQNAINYSASRCPACCFGYHHFKLSLIDSHRPSYQLYLCIVDSQSLCINAISVAQRTHHSAPSAVGPHLKATEVSLA